MNDLRNAIRRIAALFVIAAVVGTAGTTARAEVIERVVAVVNDEAIFLSDLRQRAAPFLSRIASIPSEAQRMQAIEQLYNELLDRMVQEELFIQAAEDLQVSVTRAEVDRAIRNVQEQNNLEDAQFWEAVRGQGFTPEQYRGDVRRQLLRLKVLNTRARGRVNITEQQVRARYDELQAQGRRSARFNAAAILIEVPENASATQLAAARERAQQVRESIHNVEEFERAMAQIGGGQLGWLSQGSLEPQFDEELSNLEAGAIGQPVRGQAGFMIFHLRERETGSATLGQYSDMRMEIYGQMMEAAMAEQEQIFLAELRRQAVIDLRL